MKALVPSIGSSTQTYSASPPSVPNSSPTMPWVGKVRRMSCRIAASPARSASVTGSKAPPCDLSSAASAVRKKGRIVSPDSVASSLTNVEKSIGPMAPRRRPRLAAPALYQGGVLMPPGNGSSEAERRAAAPPELRAGHTAAFFPRYAQIAWLKAWQGLQFVRRGVNCAVRYRDWRRGIAALLGRFLPRLGPHLGAAPFFVARVRRLANTRPLSSAGDRDQGCL